MKPILSPFSSKILEKSADCCLLRIRDLVKEEGGSNESGSGLEHLEYRCHKRMHKIGLNTLDSYWEMLTTLPGGQAELGKLLQELKCRTPFFSNLSQLDEFRNVVLPRIVEGKKKTGLAHVRIWTVECGTGEDTYSLGMILQEEGSRMLDNCTFEVLGTDCDEGAVNFARRALYDAQGMGSVNPHFRQSYFVAAGNQLKISLQIKARVKFELVDLLKDSQMTFIKGMDCYFLLQCVKSLRSPEKTTRTSAFLERSPTAWLLVPGRIRVALWRQPGFRTCGFTINERLPEDIPKNLLDRRPERKPRGFAGSLSGELPF